MFIVFFQLVLSFGSVYVPNMALILKEYLKTLQQKVDSNIYIKFNINPSLYF